MTLLSRCLLLAWEAEQARYRRAPWGERRRALRRLNRVTRELLNQGRSADA